MMDIHQRFTLEAQEALVRAASILQTIPRRGQALTEKCRGLLYQRPHHAKKRRVRPVLSLPSMFGCVDTLRA